MLVPRPNRFSRLIELRRMGRVFACNPHATLILPPSTAFGPWLCAGKAVKVRANNNLRGRDRMKALMILGKGLTALFWGVVLANLLQPFAQPFALLLQVMGAAVLLLHGAEYLIFKQRLAGGQKPAREMLQVLIFGIFHLLSRAEKQAESGAAEASRLSMGAENA